MRWSDVISEGVRAKLFKRVSDTERARNCYSLYGQLRQGLMTSEVADVGGSTMTNVMSPMLPHLRLEELYPDWSSEVDREFLHPKFESNFGSSVGHS
jgi:hypothetical protein